MQERRHRDRLGACSNDEVTEQQRPSGFEVDGFRLALDRRRDVARIFVTLRTEFSGTAHPIGTAVDLILEDIVKRCERLINAGRAAGAIPSGPPATTVALALVGAVEGAMIQLPDRTGDDELIAQRLVLGVLGLNADMPSSETKSAMVDDDRRAR